MDKENIEFALTKLDSIAKYAMPYIEKGSEQFVKYHVIGLWVDYAVCLVILAFFPFICFKLTKASIKATEENSDNIIHIMFYPIIAFVTAVISFITVILMVVHISDLVMTFVAPEVYVIMKLIRS